MKRNIEKVVKMLTKHPKQKLGGISIVKSASILLFLITLTSLANFSCTKKKTTEAIFDETTSNTLYFYKGKDSIYSPKGTSPHGYFKLKFNKTAFEALGADGKLPQGQTFPEGSLVVKEVYNSNNQMTLYAVMKKNRKSKFASHKWVWAEYAPNGDVVISISREGKDCVDCHTGGSPRDLVLSFDLH